MGATSTHFSNQELACHHCGINNCQIELVDALESLRVEIGLPIIIDSAYRCPIHNAEVGGVPNSEHVQGIAADIRVENMSASDIYLAALKIPAFKGIGVAPTQNYIHVDTRPEPARWAYDVNGKWCTWNLDLPLNIESATSLNV